VKRRWLSLWVVFVVALVAIELGIVTGLVAIDPLTNFYFVIVALAVIGVLAIIGAVFIGIFMTHRIFAGQEFTPFEKEMLGMREDVKKLTAKVDELSGRLAGDPGKKD
jgi:cytochrome b subunit of formate dehydrogenase